MDSLATPRSTDTVALADAGAGPDRLYYSVSQAAARLGVSRVTIWRLIRAGDLPVRRLGHRTVRIRGQDLDAILAGPSAVKAAHLDAAPLIGDPHEHGSADHFVQFYES